MKTTKKILCFLLCLTLWTGMGSAAFADESTDKALTGEETENPVSEETEEEEAVSYGVSGYPVVYVSGMSSYLYSDKDDPDSEIYYTASLPDGALAEIADALTPELTRGIFTGKWEEFSDALYKKLSPYFAPLKLDDNGNVGNKTGYDCLKESVITDKKKNGLYGLYDYSFVYDWRLDPCLNAVELDSYINAVLAATGAEKVDLIVSGLGSGTVLAYFYQFGSAVIHECVFREAGLNGISAVGALFSGKMETDENALNRYIQQSLSDNDIILGFVQYAADLLLTEGFADSLLTFSAKIYSEIYKNVLPRILLESFATMPGCWSAISDEYYGDARALIFENTEEDAARQERYSVLLEKLDHFHNNILNNAKSILNEARANGVGIYNIVKYGAQLIPVSQDHDITSDTLVSIKDSTFGAVCAKPGEKFSKEYLNDASETGMIMLISPDSEINAAGAYLPAHTWFIKNAVHGVQSEPVDELTCFILENEGYTSVFDTQEYPQYLVCSKNADRMEPLTETGVITPTTEEKIEEFFRFDSPSGFIKKIFSVIAKIVSLLRYFIDSMKDLG